MRGQAARFVQYITFNFFCKYLDIRCFLIPNPQRILQPSTGMNATPLHYDGGSMEGENHHRILEALSPMGGAIVSAIVLLKATNNACRRFSSNRAKRPKQGERARPRDRLIPIRVQKSDLGVHLVLHWPGNQASAVQDFQLRTGVGRHGPACAAYGLESGLFRNERITVKT